MLLASPAAVLGGFEAWRATTLILFGVGTFLSRRRCLGCLVVGTRMNKEGTLYCALYFLGFSTTLLWVWMPGDLLAVNLSCQALCLRLTGNTVHGWLTGTHSVRV